MSDENRGDVSAHVLAGLLLEVPVEFFSTGIEGTTIVLGGEWFDGQFGAPA